jgi:hypothetical protein
LQILRTVSPVITVVTDALADAVTFYEALYGEPTRQTLSNPAGTLKLSLVGPALIISGTADALLSRRDLKATLVVASLDACRAELVDSGVTIVEDVSAGPFKGPEAVGRFLFARHPDGNLFEYFQPAG